MEFYVKIEDLDEIITNHFKVNQKNKTEEI